MSLLEVMVVIAILLVLVAVMVPATNSLFQLEQRKAARDLALTYERLHDEAVMRNLTFRIVYYLNEGKYVVETGKPGGLIASGADERQRYEEELERKLRSMTEDERREWARKNEQPFEMLNKEGKMERILPGGVRFGGVYTPQYDEMVEPDGKERKEDESPQVAYSYIMSTGFAEHTVVWLADAADPEDGWTIEVEPLSGAVRLHGELIDWRDSFDFVPEEGPSLP